MPKITDGELEQFRYHLQQRQAGKEVMDQAQSLMQQAQETWRVASGGMDSFVQFLVQKYHLEGNVKIDPETGIISGNAGEVEPQKALVNGAR